MTIEVHRGEAGASWINATGGEVSDSSIQPVVDRVGREIANWVSTQRAKPSLYNRQAYVAPDNPFTLMNTARKAVENDDVVGGVCDVTEGLMLQGVQWESGEADEMDIFNQMSRDLNLDAFTRQWHREEYMHSQVVIGAWWGRNTFKIRGRSTSGVKRKKTVTITCPRALTFLDPARVVPLKPGPFGQDRLAWYATKSEFMAAADPMSAIGDPVLREFTLGAVPQLDKDEIDYLTTLGVDHRRLLLLNPGSVFRATRTKMSYERFPALRLKSVFPLLDLKQQLMEADRVNLVGAANYILLVRQGSKDEPAAQAELDNLQENFKVVAKLPVVIGDHRLSIDIITPDQTHVLDSAKYNTIDQRILARALGALSVSSGSARSESGGMTLSRGIARTLETRRHMMKRTLEEHIARRVVDHPGNAGVFSEEPKLTFTPRNVQLDNDGETVRAILALRTQKELSRESTLEFFGFDQATEALRREMEEEFFDDIFQTQVPFSAAGNPGGDGVSAEGQGEEPAQVSGARGGRPKGGGDSPQSVQGQVKGRTGTGNPKKG